MPLETLLKERLAERAMKMSQLAKKTGISANTLSGLANNQLTKILFDHIVKICVALEIGPEELFRFYEPDVFFGARCSGNLTIHVSYRLLPSDGWGTSGLRPLAVNQWDFQALQIVQDYATAEGIQVQTQVHNPNEFQSYPQQAQALLDSGNHVVIASQLTSDLTEHVVSKMVGVPAADPDSRRHFEMLFGWDRRPQPSSFGFQVDGGQSPGIYRPREEQPIALRTYVDAGHGQDCGLIVVWRNHPRGARRGNRQDHYVVVLAGHGGPGTEACARVLIDPKKAKPLYPQLPSMPIMCAVQASYDRPRNGPIDQDNRILNSDYVLVR